MGKRKKPINLLGLIFVVCLIVFSLIYYWVVNNLNETDKDSVKVYFFDGDKLIGAERRLLSGEVPLEKAMKELLKGPRQAEAAQGVTTQIPVGTKLIGLTIKNKLAIVNLNDKIENYGGGSTRLRGMIGQIVYTATNIPGIEKVWIWEEGKRELVLGGEGLVLDHPLSRVEVSF